MGYCPFGKRNHSTNRKKSHDIPVLIKRIYKYFEEANEEPVVFHWKYNLDDVDVSEAVIVDTLPIKKSS